MEYEIGPGALVVYGLASILPFLLFGPVEYFTGRTPGKLATRLVTNDSGIAGWWRPLRYLVRGLLYSGVTTVPPLFLVVGSLDAGLDGTGQYIYGLFLYLLVLAYQLFDFVTLAYPPTHRSATERITGVSVVDRRQGPAVFDSRQSRDADRYADRSGAI